VVEVEVKQSALQELKQPLDLYPTVENGWLEKVE
jgi:hypothetical protein